jgi:transcriptional regulator with XRE-family HTH domain
MAQFQAKLDHLFRTVRPPDGSEYSYRQVASGIERLVGYRTSPSYVQELRAGRRINPSMKHLHGLCSFFGVPIGYFFDEDLAARVDAELQVAVSFREPGVRDLAERAVGLSSETLRAIIRIVDEAHRIARMRVTQSATGAQKTMATRARRAHRRTSGSDRSSTHEQD